MMGFFYKYIYIFKTESVLWNVTEKVCLFLTRANGTKSDSGDEIYSSTELCLKGETVGLDLSEDYRQRYIIMNMWDHFVNKIIFK